MNQQILEIELITLLGRLIEMAELGWDAVENHDIETFKKDISRAELHTRSKEVYDGVAAAVKNLSPKHRAFINGMTPTPASRYGFSFGVMLGMNVQKALSGIEELERIMES